MTERLARRGKVGAEELTDTLNTVFRELLDVARDLGGDCLKFGGDALLLLFTGPDHARQAASAAVEMRQDLRRSALIPTSVGRLKLAISIAVAPSSRPRPSRAVAEINAEKCLIRLSGRSAVGGTGLVFGAVESMSTMPATSSGYCEA